MTTFLLGIGARWMWAWGKVATQPTLRTVYGRICWAVRLLWSLAFLKIQTPRHFEQFGLMGVGDAWALSVLEGWFKSIRFTTCEIRHARKVSGDILKSPVCFIILAKQARPVKLRLLRQYRGPVMSKAYVLHQQRIR
jgi:hypothetical protein